MELNNLRKNLLEEISNQINFKANKPKNPKSNSKPIKQHSQSKKRLSMYDRQMLWEKMRKNKIQDMKEVVELGQLEDCTFQP